ncbi:hypothetical protein CPB86DRAFT_602224 [Serendipita vermifera]|nr:hypothetical protein CPB86DRAFT_602224 [Serendipita vermifera]
MLFSSFATLLIASSALAAPVPRWKREVPQEHSHEAIIRAVRPVLNLNNPDAIVDVIFGLLGNAAASTGKGNIEDPDCLQTATADQAFTNAKAAGDVAGMTAALQYRALERNTGAVGQASVLCTSFTPVNPEIAALSQHQDPASDNAAAVNKAIVLELAKQIFSIGGDPLDALATGTFAPGQIGDPTARGNTCDDENDAIGCIISQNLIVFDATEDEILAAVGGGDNGNDNAAPDATDSAEADCPSVVTVTVTADTAAATSTEAAAPATTSAAADNSNDTGNLQSFSGALGGIEAPKVSRGGRNFVVENNADFLNIGAALGRSCDVQHNQCANAANSGAGFSVGDCDRQNDQCKQAISGANVAAITTRQESTTTAASVGQGGANLQAFNGALGGIQAPAVTRGGRNFVVANNADFLNIGAALGRSCDVQHNQCANAANSGAGFSVGDCDRQNDECRRNI